MSPLASQSARRTWWRDITFEGVSEPPPPRLVERLAEVDDEREAHLVGSLTTRGLHAPTLDVDFPIVVRRLAGGRTQITYDEREHVATDDVVRELAALGWIAPLDRTRTGLTLSVPVTAIPSSTRGHRHVYIDAEITWERYARLLGVLERARVLRGKFYAWALERRKTLLFKPGLTKRQIQFQRVMLCRGCSSCDGAPTCYGKEA